MYYAYRLKSTEISSNIMFGNTFTVKRENSRIKGNFVDETYQDNAIIVGLMGSDIDINADLYYDITNTLDTVFISDLNSECDQWPECLRKHNGEKWEDEEQAFLKRVIRKTAYSDDGEDSISEILSIITGNIWKYEHIHGSEQSSQATLFYNSEVIKEEDTEYIQAMYFRTGTVFCITETEPGIGLNGEINAWPQDCHYVSVTGFTIEDLSRAIGCKSEDIEMYEEDERHSIY